MSTTHFDLSAFESAARTRLPLPGDLRRRRRTMLVTIVCGPLAVLTGILLVRFGLQDWNRLTVLLTAGGAGAVLTSLLFLQQISPADAFRISRFAADNGFDFAVVEDSAGYRGSNFTSGHSHQRLLVVRGEFSGHPVEFGNLSFRNGAGRAPWVLPGYVAIRLPDRLPHAIITSRRPLRTLVACAPSADDRIQVPGGDAFRVYAPPGAEQVVRSIFTTQATDTFARLNVHYDIEIRDDVLFLYSRRPVSTGSGRDWRRILSHVAELCALIGPSPVWEVMRHRPKSFLSRLPELGRDFEEARVKKIALLSFGAFMILVTVLVVWLH